MSELNEPCPECGSRPGQRHGYWSTRCDKDAKVTAEPDEGPKPLTRQRSSWQQLDTTAALGASAATALDELLGGAAMYGRRVHDGELRAIVAEEPTGWHLSISQQPAGARAARYPTWDEIAHARYELLPSELDFVMHLPPPAEYVAVHDTTFHLHEHPERNR